MRMLRKPLLAGALAAAAFGAVQSAPADDQPAREYVVVYESDAAKAAARDAVADAGGSIVKENAAIGVATVRSERRGLRAQGDRRGRARRRRGEQADRHGRAGRQEEGDPGRERPARRGQGRARRQKGEPLAANQWDMRMIGATPEQSYRTQPGSRQVLVGIIDTGVDASHPDIAAELREVALAQLHHGHARHRRARARTSRTSPARTPPTPTRAATARTWRAPSARRSTASASPAWPRRPAS